MQKIFEAKKLAISFSHYTKGWQQEYNEVVHDISLDVYPNEVVAIIGASGSGKSLFAEAVMGLLAGNARVNGQMFFKGELLSHQKIKEYRGKQIVFIPQSIAVLDPLIKIGTQLQLSLTTLDAKEKIFVALRQFALKEEVYEMYPHELSGGMARRILVVMAFLADPSLIIADEPTPGMDQEAVSEMLRQIVGLKREGRSIVIISHDIAAALQVADRIAIFKDGNIIEIADVQQFTGRGEKLKTSYAQSLWQALPSNQFLSAVEKGTD